MAKGVPPPVLPPGKKSWRIMWTGSGEGPHKRHCGLSQELEEEWHFWTSSWIGSAFIQRGGKCAGENASHSAQQDPKFHRQEQARSAQNESATDSSSPAPGALRTPLEGAATAAVFAAWLLTTSSAILRFRPFWNPSKCAGPSWGSIDSEGLQHAMTSAAATPAGRATAAWVN